VAVQTRSFPADRKFDAKLCRRFAYVFASTSRAHLVWSADGVPACPDTGPESDQHSMIIDASHDRAPAQSWTLRTAGRRQQSMLSTTFVARQLPMRSSDRGIQSTECQRLWRWRASDAQLAVVRSLAAGIQVRHAAVDAYRMPVSANNPPQDVRSAMSGAAHVTNTKFSTRLGPPPDRPV
jgi:hypothetical protein